MPKSFMEAFEEWKRDNRYQVGEDIGWEYSDTKEASPTLAQSSLTPEPDHATKDSKQKIVDQGTAPG